jgi:hypothetical protein
MCASHPVFRSTFYTEEKVEYDGEDYGDDDARDYRHGDVITFPPQINIPRQMPQLSGQEAEIKQRPYGYQYSAESHYPFADDWSGHNRTHISVY